MILLKSLAKLVIN